jgi:hypothetical protein
MATDPVRHPAVYVHWYLCDVAPAIHLLFYALLELVSGDSAKVQRIKELEKQKLWSSILAYGDIGDIDEKVREGYRKEAATRTEQLASIDLELDELRNGEEGKTLAVASLAGGILFIAHHGIEIGEKHAKAVGGREIIEGYNLKDFIVQARDHAAHFAETEPWPKRERFQKEALAYDQRAERTTVNHSYRLLEMLKWRSWNDIRSDLLSLFNPKGERLEFGRSEKLHKLPGSAPESGSGSE